MFWIALAAQLSASNTTALRIPDVRVIFSPDDFPAYLQMAGISRRVQTRTTVRPDGTVESCKTEFSSGDRKLDAYTCALIVKRAKLQPARWIDGSATYGVIRVPVDWVIANSLPTEIDMTRAADPDVDLTVDHLPKEAGSMALINLELAVDATGRAVACAEWPQALPKSKKHFPDLVAVACQKVSTDFTAIPPVDAVGKPTQSVQTVSVRFAATH